MPAHREKDFVARLPGWLEKVAGALQAPHAIDIQAAKKPKSLGRYFLKGMEEVYAPYYGVKFEAQGVVHGKRAGISQNLGPKAKKELREAGRYPLAKPFGVGMERQRPTTPHQAPRPERRPARPS